MKIIYILLLLVSCDFDFIGTENNKEEEIKRLEDAKTYEDTIYVIDNWSFSDGGYRKPPCSMSPDYERCMNSRIDGLGLEVEVK